MHKYMDVDITASLEAVMRQNTRHYQSDFEYDRATIQRAAESLDPEEKTLVWMSRESGTWCFKERDVLLQDSEAFSTWSTYENTSGEIVASQVEVSGIQDGRVMGNLYEMDYREHLEYLTRSDLPANTLQVTFEDGSQHRFDRDEYHGRRTIISQKYGDAIGYRLEANDPAALETVMRQEKAARQRLKPGSFEKYLAGLSGNRKPSVLEQLKSEQPAQEGRTDKPHTANMER